MNPEDFIYNSILNGAKAKGVSDHIAKRFAEDGLEIYRQNRFDGKPSKLIEKQITKAKEVTE